MYYIRTYTYRKWGIFEDNKYCSFHVFAAALKIFPQNLMVVYSYAIMVQYKFKIYFEKPIYKFLPWKFPVVRNYADARISKFYGLICILVHFSAL